MHVLCACSAKGSARLVSGGQARSGRRGALGRAPQTAGLEWAQSSVCQGTRLVSEKEGAWSGCSTDESERGGDVEERRAGQVLGSALGRA